MPYVFFLGGGQIWTPEEKHLSQNILVTNPKLNFINIIPQKCVEVDDLIFVGFFSFFCTKIRESAIKTLGN